MRHNRFYTPSSKGSVGDTITIQDNRIVHQVSRVLRMNAGDPLVLFGGDGYERIGHIVGISSKDIQVTVTEVKEKNRLLQPVTLCCAILKRSNFELVVQKATEVGVKEIVPLLTQYVVKTGLSIERLNKIAIEAAEQSGRTTIPVIHDPASLSEAFDTSIKLDNQVIFFDGTGEELSRELSTGEYSIYIGPEGGWSTEEVGLAQEKGATIASLGSLTLRAETAAIVATYTVGHKR